MPITVLSKGYKKPSNPTYGDLWFPAMEDNIQRMNDHTHNGTDGAQIANQTVSASSGSWGSDLGGGSYRQLITTPTGMQYDSTRISVRRSTGEQAYPTLERVSATTFYIYTNNNAITYTLSFV
jgi:hypothetical protein